ncbi:hypothetical protein CBL_06086 [Carabus blaptoides fortunei]
MAPKRFKKSEVNGENSEKYKNLNISDVLCPICRSILIEPVTLPCRHGFCLACFNVTMENTALTCPLCRIRIGSWLRTARKENKIINTTFWDVIQLKFSKEIRKKLNGEDVVSDEKTHIKLANPGEIRREYEIQLEKERSEIQKKHDAETKASEFVIKKILEEEQNAVRIEEEKMRIDEEVARRLANNSGPGCSQSTPKSAPKKSSIDKYLKALNKKKQDIDTSKNKLESVLSNQDTYKLRTSTESSSTKSCTSTIMCQSRDKKQCSNAYKHLLLTKTLQCERANSNGSDSGDSIKQEMTYFKPIRSVPKSMPKLQGDGNIVRTPLLKVPTIHPRTNNSYVIRSPQINMVACIKAHSSSAFVSCGHSTDSPVTAATPAKQPYIVGDNGRIIKQYYNKKRNSLYATPQSHTATSPVTSPLLGFELGDEQLQVVKMKKLLDVLMENKNEPLQFNVKYTKILNECSSENKITLSINARDAKRNGNDYKRHRSSKRINGCDPEKLNATKPTRSTTVDRILQEQLDLEYAKKLHEELNNPRTRQTRASVQAKKVTSTRSSPRKRQVTLDELISPKKFKI